jgi:hypothetical protein
VPSSGGGRLAGQSERGRGAFASDARLAELDGVSAVRSGDNPLDERLFLLARGIEASRFADLLEQIARHRVGHDLVDRRALAAGYDVAQFVDRHARDHLQLMLPPDTEEVLLPERRKYTPLERHLKVPAGHRMRRERPPSMSVSR